MAVAERGTVEAGGAFPVVDAAVEVHSEGGAQAAEARAVAGLETDWVAAGRVAAGRVEAAVEAAAVEARMRDAVREALGGFADDTRMKLLCWRGDVFDVTSSQCGEGKCYPHTEEDAKFFYYDWILDIAMAHPNMWLPIDEGMIVKLQALVAVPAAPAPTPGTTSVAAVSRYNWFGIVSGGKRMPLPSSYVAVVFQPSKLAEAEQRAVAAAAAGKRPRPVDVSDVGATVSSLSCLNAGLAPASAVKTSARAVASASVSATVLTAVVGAPEVRFPQGDKDYCVAFSAASAVHHAGDKKVASEIYSMAAPSLKQPVGVNRVKWVTHECVAKLQRLGWRTSSKPLKNAQRMNKADLLALLSTPDVVTVIQLEDSGGDIRHCVAAYGDWLFDPNKPRAVSLDVDGLDACCLGGATFVKAYAGFQLVRNTDKQAVPKRPVGENDSPNAHVVKKMRNA
jgi:hypothetical protein